MEFNGPEIMEFLEQLAQKLTPAAQYVFSLAIRQVVIEGIFSSVLAVASLIVFPVIAYKFGHRGYRFLRDQKKVGSIVQEDYEIGSIILVLAMIALSIISLVEGFSFLKTAFNNLLNPEWQALMRIAELVPRP